MESKIDEIFQEVLDLERIGVRDDFFELGGHSLKAIKLINEINRQYKIELKIIQVFNSLTIEALSKKIKIQLWIRRSKRNNRNKVEI